MTWVPPAHESRRRSQFSQVDEVEDLRWEGRELFAPQVPAERTQHMTWVPPAHESGRRSQVRAGASHAGNLRGQRALPRVGRICVPLYDQVPDRATIAVHQPHRAGEQQQDRAAPR